MWDRCDPRSSEPRDRGDSVDRSRGTRGGSSERERADERDPRDVFTKPEPPPSPGSAATPSSAGWWADAVAAAAHGASPARREAARMTLPAPPDRWTIELVNAQRVPGPASEKTRKPSDGVKPPAMRRRQVRRRRRNGGKRRETSAGHGSCSSPRSMTRVCAWCNAVEGRQTIRVATGAPVTHSMCRLCAIEFFFVTLLKRSSRRLRRWARR